MNVTEDTKQLQEWDKQYFWHPFTQMQTWVDSEPLIIERGEGVYLYDTEGNRYYDGVSSLWVNVIGHNHPKVNQAITEQLNQVAHTTTLGLTNVPAIKLARKLVEIAPEGLNKVFYSDSGSTAVEIAIKMAFQYWSLVGRPEKRQFITLREAYHGDTVGSVSVGGIDVFHRIFGPLLFETKAVKSPCCFYCEYKQICQRFCIQEVQKVLEEHHHEIAAMVVEPLVQGAAGMLTQSAGYLKAVRELTKKYDVLLIVDEVATGFGRTGTLFACEQQDVAPDFMTVAKGLTAGYLPLAATLTTDQIYEAFLGKEEELKTFFHGHSFTGNPVACAAALANLEIYEEEQIIEKLPPKIEAIRQALLPFQELPGVADIRQCGMMVGIDLAGQPPQTGAKVCEAVRKKGLILRPLGNVIVFLPPLVISEEQIKEILNILYETLQETL